MLNLVCLLEEPSAKNTLQAIFPKILPAGVYPRYIVFEGKQDLEKHIQKRMQYYNEPNSVFLVMRDQDSGDCHLIKNGLQTKIALSGKLDNTLIRIACHELESFFLGDLRAVEKGLEIKNLEKHQNNKKFRTPDVLRNAKQELRKLTKDTYQPMAGSRAIAPYLSIDGSNKSHSFNIFIEGVQMLCNRGLSAH